MAFVPEAIRPMRAPHFKLDPTPNEKGKVVTIAHIERWLKEDGFLIGQPKADGMRVLNSDMARSRSGKPWTNRYMQQWVKDRQDQMWGWDGEMFPDHFDFANPDPEVFRRAMSGCRSQEGSSKLTYFLFDNFDDSWINKPYEERFKGCIQDLGDPVKQLHTGTCSDGAPYEVLVYMIPWVAISSIDEMFAYHEENNAFGWEGTMMRRRFSRYKRNKCTPNEGFLFKIKDEDSAEAEIIGYEPAYENQNEATISPLGYTARSAHQANLVETDRLGAFILRDLKTKVEFRCGVFKGLTHDDLRRMLILAREGKLDGYVGSYISQGYGGGYDKPRTPRWDGIRNKIDL